MKYLAIDPGGTTGWAKFDADGNLLGCSKIQGGDKFLDWLEDQEAGDTTLILEDYKVRPWVNHSYSSVPTLQIIGAIKRVAQKKEWTLVEQQPQCMHMGLRYLGLYAKYGGGKKHVPDDQSALAHGVYYLVKTGVRKHRLAK